MNNSDSTLPARIASVHGTSVRVEPFRVVLSQASFPRAHERTADGRTVSQVIGEACLRALIDETYHVDDGQVDVATLHLPANVIAITERMKKTA